MPRNNLTQRPQRSLNDLLYKDSLRKWYPGYSLICAFCRRTDVPTMKNRYEPPDEVQEFSFESYDLQDCVEFHLYCPACGFYLGVYHEETSSLDANPDIFKITFIVVPQEWGIKNIVHKKK